MSKYDISVEIQPVDEMNDFPESSQKWAAEIKGEKSAAEIKARLENLDISHATRPSIDKVSNDDVEMILVDTEMSHSQLELSAWAADIKGELNPDTFHETRPSMDSNSSNSSKSEKLPSIIGAWQCWDDFAAVSLLSETQKKELVVCMEHWFGLRVLSYLQYMEEKVDLAWSYYGGVNDFRAQNRERFIEHLLYNSCFLIFAMVLIAVLKNPAKKWVAQKELLDVILAKRPPGLRRRNNNNIIDFLLEDPNRVQCYMLTMDCQMPWFVLEALYTNLSNIGSLLETPLHKFALSCLPTHTIVHKSKYDGDTIPDGGFKHILHIFHWSQTPHKEYLVDTSMTTKWIRYFHIPSARDLQLSQIFFKKHPQGYFDVSYSHKRILSREIQLTPLYLSQYNTKIYESLLKFEQLYGAFCGHSFTAYITCMACLLKTEDDVRVLRAYGIIPSTMSNDKDVLPCVEELKTLIPVNLKIPNELIILEEKVMTHYQRRAFREYGEFKRRYCSNPWITITVIGGIIIAGFGLIQTIYAALDHNKKS